MHGRDGLGHSEAFCIPEVPGREHFIPQSMCSSSSGWTTDLTGHLVPGARAGSPGRRWFGGASRICAPAHRDAPEEQVDPNHCECRYLFISRGPVVVAGDPRTRTALKHHAQCCPAHYAHCLIPGLGLTQGTRLWACSTASKMVSRRLLLVLKGLRWRSAPVPVSLIRWIASRIKGRSPYSSRYGRGASPKRSGRRRGSTDAFPVDVAVIHADRHCWLSKVLGATPRWVRQTGGYRPPSSGRRFPPTPGSGRR